MSLIETVRQAAGTLAADITDARQVRVLCPHGHRIVELAAITLRDGLVLTAPLGGLDHPEFAAELAELAEAAPHRAPPKTRGMLRQSGDRIGLYVRGEVELDCPRRACRYHGSFEYYSFSADIGKSALGHTEHQLVD